METNGLTRREREVLALMLKGFSCKRIAEELNISITTVLGYRSNVLLANCCESISELLAMRIKELEEELEEIKDINELPF